MDENITLVNDWDYQPKIGSDLGHHVKRESEHRILFDFISRRKEGSMLVCGQRGSGKTSSIFKTTNEALSYNSKIKPVLIKATSINLDDDKKKDTLRSFIRSLYNQIKDDSDVEDELKTKTSKFYNKAIASQVKNENTLQNTILREKTSRIHINFISALSIIAVGILSLLIDFSNYDWIFSVVAFLTGSWLLFDYSKIVKKSSSSLASHYYLYDFDFSTMQSEFESLLTEFAEKDYKILFILDELDKVGESSIEIISNLKMLINQGNALFIFITDPKFLITIRKKENSFSTLFSQILFFKRPLFDEIKKFLDEIFIFNKDEIEKQNYQNFKDFLCYQSRNGFFNLYNAIRDNITSTDDGKSFLEINLNNENTTKANLQKSIEWVYERKKFDTPSKWEENDEILETLYDICEQLEDTPKLQNIVIEDFTFKFPKNSIHLPKPKLYSSAMDLFTFLTSQGYLQNPTENNFQIIGQLKTIIETKGGIFYEEQSKFVEEYDRMIQLTINMANLHNHFVSDLGEIFSLENINGKWIPFTACVNTYFNITTLEDHRKVYFDLIGNDPTVYSSEKLQKMTTEIRNGCTAIKGGFQNLPVSIFNKNIHGLSHRLTHGDISRGILTATGIPNTTFRHSEFAYSDMEKNRLENIVISYNIPIDFLNQLLEKATNTNLLIISWGDSEEISKYKSEFSVLSLSTISEALNNLSEIDKGSQWLFLPISIPIETGDMKKLLESLEN